MFRNVIRGEDKCLQTSVTVLFTVSLGYMNVRKENIQELL